MSLWKPRLEWNDLTKTVTTTNLSPTLTSIASTTNLNTGMFVTGAGIPANAKIVSKTATSVTLNKDCNASATITATFFERYDFEFPPVKDSEEVWKPKQTITDSLNGTTQITTLYLEAIRSLEFFFVTQEDADKLKDNFYLYAYKGFSFRYYPDQDETPVYNMILERFEFSRNRQVKKHPNFKYSINFVFRRVVE